MKSAAKLEERLRRDDRDLKEVVEEQEQRALRVLAALLKRLEEQNSKTASP